MDELQNWSVLLLDSLKTFINKAAMILPSIIGALLIFIFGYLFAKLFSYIITRFLKSIKFDGLAEKVQASKILESANFKITATELISKFSYWLLLFFVLITAADTLGWNSVSNEISAIISYLPKIIIAIIIFIIGSYLVGIFRNIIKGTTTSLGIGTGKILASVVYYFLMTLVSLTSLKQAGVDTSILSSNLSLIFGSILVAASISYGFASKDVLSNILAAYFNKNTYERGMTIEVDGLTGTIQYLSSTNISLLDKEGNSIIIPMSVLLKSNVKIFKKQSQVV